MFRFVSTLEQQAGEVYEPLYMAQQAFDDIINAPMEMGGGGRGQSRGGAGMMMSESGAYGQGQGRGAGMVGNDGFASDCGQDQGRGSYSAMETHGRGADEYGRSGDMAAIEWETLSGTVTSIDYQITIQTDDGEVQVGMGRSAFWEGFALDIGDQVTVTGFYEDGEFKAGTVENVTTGATITLRDEAGRPMWAGHGRMESH